MADKKHKDILSRLTPEQAFIIQQMARTGMGNVVKSKKRPKKMALNDNIMAIIEEMKGHEYSNEDMLEILKEEQGFNPDDNELEEVKDWVHELGYEKE